MPTIADYRNKFPSLRALDDAALIDRVAEVQGVAREDVIAHMGWKPKPAGLLRSVADLGIEAASGVARGVKATADAFGADNAVSQGADAVDKFARDYLSASAKADDRRVSDIMAAAQDAGVWEQVKAAAEAFTVKPVAMTMNALGTSVPTIATALIPGVGQAGVAARLGALGAMGAAQGAGAVKGSIYEAVKAEQIKAGASDADAEAAAVQAQEYGGENAANIAGGAALGGAASATGVQPVIAKMLQRGAEPVVQAGQRGMLQRALNPEGLLARTGMGALKEAPLEAAQGGQEQYASNIALQNEGFDAPAFRGVAGAAALEGLASAGPGAAFAAISKPAVRGEEAPKPDPVVSVLAAPSVDDAINAAKEAIGAPAVKPRQANAGAAAELAQLDPADRAEALSLMQVSERQDVSGNVRRYAQNRLDELLAPVRQIPIGEAADVLPVGDATELTDAERAEYANAVPLTYRRALERGLPQPEVTEVLPTGEALDLEPIEAGEASELDVETIQPTDLTTGDGVPYGSKTAANVRAVKEGGTPADVVEIPGAGWIVRLKNAQADVAVDADRLREFDPNQGPSGLAARVSAQRLRTDQPDGTPLKRAMQRGAAQSVIEPPKGPNDYQRDVAGTAAVAAGPADGASNQPGRSGGTVGRVADDGRAGQVDAGLPTAAAGGNADQAAGPASGNAGTALNPGQRITLAGKSYTVVSATPSAVKLSDGDGGTRMVATGSKTFQAIQQEPNGAARQNPQAAAGESAAPAAAPAPAAPAVVPGAGPTDTQAGGVKADEPWKLTREQAAKDYPGDEYDRMLNRSSDLGDIPYVEADRRARTNAMGQRKLWAKTRAQLEQEGKDAVKAARGDRAAINKLKGTPEFANWRLKAMSLKGKEAIAEAERLARDYLAIHKDRVQEALMEGKDVPAEVLADYPDLKRRAATNAPAPVEAPSTSGAGVPAAEAPKPLYASRPVTNAADIMAWAASQGFKSTLPANDLHVTVAYSRDAVDGAKAGPAAASLTVIGGKRTVEPLGDEGAIVLKFTSPDMQARWKQYRDAGASWDYESYTPHVTITYDGKGVDLSKVKPYTGPIELGAEKQEPLNVDKADDYKEAGEAPAATAARDKRTLQEKVERPAAADEVVATAGQADAEGERKFYVTMVRGDHVARLAGPFDTKAEADAMLPRARDAANEADPRSAFDAFGVSGITSTNHRPGTLNERLGITKPPELQTEAEFGAVLQAQAIVEAEQELKQAKAGEYSTLRFKSKAAAVRAAESNLKGAKESRPEQFAGDHLGAINKAIAAGRMPSAENIARYDIPAEQLQFAASKASKPAEARQAPGAAPAGDGEAQATTSPAAEATAILNAAAEPPKGAERLSVLKDVKAGAITPEEVAAAFPPAEPAPITDVGEKIGGARKDMAESGGTRAKKGTTDERPAWARRFEISQIVTPGGMVGEVKDAGRWIIRDARSLDWMKQPKQVGRSTYATKEEAEAFVPLAAVSLKHRTIAARDGKYEIWRDINDRKRVKVVDQQFDSREAAMAYMLANAVQIIEANTTFGEADLPLPPDRARKGVERRTGNVNGQDFKDTFGLRGVEFGNWNNQDERQALMNDAWDGLMDLAEVLNVPPKALGMSGDLALAFGARGHGLNSARAHYEPARAVINLTKESGAGSLAHEWFHALDHYFGRQDGKASAAWKVGEDGTRTLAVAGDGAEMVSSGFRGERSGVRKELREAYDAMLRTMTKKAETYVEDTAKADKFTGVARDELASALASLRRELAEQKDVRYYKRNNKPASAELLAEFDAIAKQMLDGEVTALATDWKTFLKGGDKPANARGASIATRWTNDSLERLSAIHKEVRGRSGFDGTNKQGVMDRLRGNMERYSQRLKMLADAQGEVGKVRAVPTDFAMNARELDQGRGTDYWTTPHEMAARAFQGYVEDKIAERGGMSRFLNYAPENAAILTPWGFKRPYPAGEERKAINAALDKFISALETRADDAGNVAMFSRAPGIAKDVANAWRILSENDEVFTYAKSDSTDFSEIATGTGAIFAEPEPGTVGADVERAWRIYPAAGGQPDKSKRGHVIHYKDGKVELNVDKFTEGSAGSAAYAAVGNYAFNNSLQFAPDRFGMSQAAIERRLENLISLALKFGSTDFIRLSPSQLKAFKMKWRDGDTAFNTEQMLMASYNALAATFPEIKSYTYDLNTGTRKSDVGAVGRDEPGTEGIVARARAAGARAGERTISRAIFTNTFASEPTGKARRELVGRLGEGNASLLGDNALAKSLYSRVPGANVDLDKDNDQSTAPAFNSGTMLSDAGLDAVRGSDGEGLSGGGGLRDRSGRNAESASPGGEPEGAAAQRELGQGVRDQPGRLSARPGVPMADAEAVADAIRAAYPTGPQIVMLDDVRKAPEQLLEQIRNAQASNTVEGAYWKGKIYLFPQNVADIQRLMFVGAHHEIRHAGLDALFGKRKGALLLGIAMSNPKVAKAARAKMADGLAESMIAGTEEALADMPLEDMAKLNGWSKIVAAVRQWLRGMADKLQRNHPKLAAMIRPDEWTDNDVAALIRRAEDISRGGTVPARSAGAVFSRADQTQTPAFRRWFGDSKVVDAQGKPLVVYHGTTKGGFTTFNRMQSTKWRSASMDTVGSWFSDNPSEDGGAGMYAAGGESAIYPVYLSIQNPKRYRTFNDFLRHMHRAAGRKMEYQAAPGRGSTEELRAELKADGYDGIELEQTDNESLMQDVKDMMGAVERAKQDEFSVKRADRLPYTQKRERLEQTLKSMRKELDEFGSSTELDKQRVFIAFEPEQIKSATGNSGAFDPDSADVRFSIRTAGTAKTTAPDWITSGSAALQGAAGKIDTYAPTKTIAEKARAMSAGWKQKLVQGMFDAYAPLKALSMDAYIAARMTKAADGAFEGMLMYGKPVMTADGGITGDLDGKGFLGAMRELNGEHDRFFMWLAGNRAERLMNEGKENLFTADEIAAMKALNGGTMPDGRPRIAAFKRALDEFNVYSKSVLDVAEKAGLIDGESRKLWEHDFYVPFYRMSQENEISGPTKIKGLVRQKAFERLKGGKENLGDLMDNTLRNWSHLLSASLANVAASKSLLAAEQAGIAFEAKEAQAKEMAKAAGLKGNATYFMDQGLQRWFVVEDAAVLQAISSMEAPALNGLPLQIMAKFKKYLTVGVTIAPAFKVRNLIRDTLAAPAANEMSFNIAKNLAQGWKATDTKTSGYAQMLFSGGLMRFGTYLEGDRAEHVKRLIAEGVDDKTILNTPQKVKAMLGKAWDAWQDFGDRMENVNRTALYQQLLDKGLTPREAAFQARDMMDFSLQGSWAAMRTLTAVVPFLNARAQGLYKLGRAAADNPKRMGYMVAAVSLASIILMLTYEDDEDWKAREDWDRDAWWWFKVGDTAYRIPKPFEVGAMGTIAERSLELMTNDEMTGARFAERMKQMVTGTFAINPVPQMFKPMLDLYANKDSFTGRQIETLGMERLSKPERYGPNTSALAKAMGSAGEYTGISPVQVDHMIRAYFGWLGTMGAATVDAVTSPFSDVEKPAKKVDDYFGGFVKELPAASSRYLEDFYEQAQATSEAMADLRRAREVGDTEKAAEIMEERGDKVAQYRVYQQAQRQLADLNKRIRLVRGSAELDADAKRLRLDELTELRNQIARRVSDRTRTREPALQ